MECCRAHEKVSDSLSCLFFFQPVLEVVLICIVEEKSNKGDQKKLYGSCKKELTPLLILIPWSNVLPNT